MPFCPSGQALRCSQGELDQLEVGDANVLCVSNDASFWVVCVMLDDDDTTGVDSWAGGTVGSVFVAVAKDVAGALGLSGDKEAKLLGEVLDDEVVAELASADAALAGSVLRESSVEDVAELGFVEDSLAVLI